MIAHFPLLQVNGLLQSHQSVFPGYLTIEKRTMCRVRRIAAPEILALLAKLCQSELSHESPHSRSREVSGPKSPRLLTGSRLVSSPAGLLLAGSVQEALESQPPAV